MDINLKYWTFVALVSGNSKSDKGRCERMLELNKIHNMDNIEGLKQLDDCVIDCCVTSPPYWNLRNYGKDGQIGLEDELSDYINKLVLVFREVRRVLKDDGTLWLNLGDTYNSSKNLKGDIKIKPKEIMGVPWRVAFALQQDGWYLRQDIIWSKGNPMPESAKDRCTRSHEYIFLLTKNSKYYYDNDSIKEPCSEASIKDFKSRKTKDNKGLNTSEYAKVRPDLFRSRDNLMPKDFRRNKRSVWSVNTKPFKGAHFAVFPLDLIEPCILAGSRENGVVLDCFMGSGTVGVSAKKNNRNYIGFELNEEYCKIAEKRIQDLK